MSPALSWVVLATTTASPVAVAQEVRPELAAKMQQLTSDPLPFLLGDRLAFADTHAHAMAKQAFEGRLVWGDDVAGDLSLRECERRAHGLAGAFGTVASIVAFADGDAALTDGARHRKRHGFVSTGSDKNFTDWPAFGTWAHQQYNERQLDRAREGGLGLLVASAVNNEVLCGLGKGDERQIQNQCTDSRNVIAQLERAWQVDHERPTTEIALTPGHANHIMAQGHLAMVLSFEASDLFACPPSQTDDPSAWQFCIAESGDVPAVVGTLADQYGVRSVQPLHEWNSNLGGAAFHLPFLQGAYVLAIRGRNKGDVDRVGSLAALGRYVKSLRGKSRDPARWPMKGRPHAADGELLWVENELGLTTLGRAFVAEVAERGLLLDAAHMSHRSVRDTLSTLDALAETGRVPEGYPLFVSHARVRALSYSKPQKREYEASRELLTEIRTRGGQFGLRTSGEPTKTWTLGDSARVEDDCFGSSKTFAQSYLFVAGELGLRPALGTDMNGAVGQVRPRFVNERRFPKSKRWACSADNKAGARRLQQQAQREDSRTNTAFDFRGLAHVGLEPQVLADLANVGVDPVATWASADQFVDMWLRTTRGAGATEAAAPLVVANTGQRVAEDRFESADLVEVLVENQLRVANSLPESWGTEANPRSARILRDFGQAMAHVVGEAVAFDPSGEVRFLGDASAPTYRKLNLDGTLNLDGDPRRERLATQNEVRWDGSFNADGSLDLDGDIQTLDVLDRAWRGRVTKDGSLVLDDPEGTRLSIRDLASELVVEPRGFRFVAVPRGDPDFKWRDPPRFEILPMPELENP